MGNKEYHTDLVMKNLWLNLVKDFRLLYGQQYASVPLNLFLEQGIQGLRAYKWPARSSVSPYLFKVEYQLENLFKRYKFDKDVHTDAELLADAKKKFFATQVRISSGLHVTEPVSRLLHEARKICRQILGTYDLEEHYSLCRFGKRASVGTTYSKSYLDIKLLQSPLTGSADHIAWFCKYLDTDPILGRIINKRPLTNGPIYTVCDTLTLAFVPKSYKALRCIMKNTLIGSFYTYGLGKVIQKRLSDVGLRIPTMQNKHGRLAKSSSRDRRLATADLSSASDSISRELLCAVLPRKWYELVKFGSIPYITMDNQRYRISSIATMGLGHTFPLQTLVFYSLLKAIGNLLGDPKMFVSVYGDDLIYPSRIHRYVKALFPELHLQLNGEKTYVKDHFRESCGSDYFRGCNVRPFQPEGFSRYLEQKEFANYIYKLLNGLALRWNEVEIPHAFDYLKDLLFLTQSEVYQVPPSFPDGSGIRTSHIMHGSGFTEPAWVNQVWVFKYLHSGSRKRCVFQQEPYYWERMRSHHNSENVIIGRWDKAIDAPILLWVKKIPQPKNYRSNLTGKRMRRLQPVVAQKQTTTLNVQLGLVDNWS